MAEFPLNNPSSPCPPPSKESTSAQPISGGDDPAKFSPANLSKQSSIHFSPVSSLSQLVTSLHPNPSTVEYALLHVNFDDHRNRLGYGTYGSVHIGRYSGEAVAVKRVVSPEASSSAADDSYVLSKRRASIFKFISEIKRYERVSHPGIVRFFGVALPPDASFGIIVTQLMHGGSLGHALDRLRKDQVPLGLTSFLNIALQTCGGLRALHSAGYSWGDAKPQNILFSAKVDPAGHFPGGAEAKISDFGLSKSVSQSLLGDTTLATSGLPPGTYSYKSPEIFAGADTMYDDTTSRASDIFSFGMVLYEMLTLRTPWKKTTLFQVGESLRLGHRPPWPKEEDADFLRPIPEILVELVERCWAQRPEERPSAEDLFKSLEHFRMSLRTEKQEQRNVSGIAAYCDPNMQECAPVSENLMRIPSKQSTISTAVPIGDASIDLHSTVGLNSTSETTRMVDISEDGDQALFDSLVSAQVPRVSPVTSPEARHSNHQETNDLSRRASNGQARAVGRSSSTAEDSYAKNSLSIGLQDLEEAHRRDAETGNTKGAEILPEHLISATDVTDASAGPVDEHHRRLPRVKYDLHDVPSDEFSDRREEMVEEISNFAAQITGVRDPLAYRDDVPSSFLETVASNMHFGDTIEGSRDLASSTASTASLRRKRSKRLQSIIEKAALAFMEIRRREEMANKMPPKQRKEAADKRALEEARLQAERHALEAIRTANSDGDFSIILAIMQDHRKSYVVVKEAARVLESYCKNEQVYYEFCEEGGIEEIMSAVVLFGDNDPDLCVSFCDSITALSEQFDDKVGHLVRATGVPSTIVEVLDKHKTETNVQISGCKSLAAIAATSELSRSAVATLGGPRVVYRAMAKNNSSFKDIDLARASLRAVRQIAQDNERAAEFLVEVCALDAVSRTAEVFTDNALESDILAAMRAFSFYNGGRRNIIMSSGLRALAEIMLRNREPEFLIQCCQFIRAIAQWRNLECEGSMLQSCIAERITTLMQISNDMSGEQGARVSWYALQACLFLASFGARSRQRLRLVGAIDTTIDILIGRKENARVVRCGTDALAELMKGEPEAKVYATKCGAMMALRTAMELHKNNNRVVNAVQWTIDCMNSGQEVPVAPAQGSQVHQELIDSGAGQAGNAGRANRRFLGFQFWKRK